MSDSPASVVCFWVGQHSGTSSFMRPPPPSAPPGSPRRVLYMLPDSRPLLTDAGSPRVCSKGACLPSPLHTRHWRHSGRQSACSRGRRDRQQQLSLPKSWRRGASSHSAEVKRSRTALECLTTQKSLLGSKQRGGHMQLLAALRVSSSRLQKRMCEVGIAP